ncbi:class F sortase [Streptomyces sp. VRA16 Mangrove soil]|uniref:class F sortase n=1 Tax=Streptomyces sp. VRA16 Mangrove soil TaxID=2817434 RepID=UPI001A9DE617|nr:class F sortase [Streptomyces sp. VRA16 Mangrove soil]MBO1334490.1 class F sortase [Streptomyces sp. VRA16 Mangrove soil]
MPAPGRGAGRDLPWIGAAVLCLLLAASAVLTWLGGASSGVSPGPSGSVPPAARRAAGTPLAPVGRAADPVRLRIPAIGVDTVVGPLSLDGDRRLPAPVGYDGAGWWREGASPGEAGPAVLAGHLDTPTGPAVFARLVELRPGDRIEITRTDRSSAVFEVLGTMEFPQDAFPSDVVYGPTRDAQLRLITCAGVYDRTAGRYLANTVVYASMVAA